MKIRSILAFGVVIGALLLFIIIPLILPTQDKIIGTVDGNCSLSIGGDRIYSFFTVLTTGCEALKFSCENSIERYGATCEWKESTNDCKCKSAVFDKTTNISKS